MVVNDSQQHGARSWHKTRAKVQATYIRAYMDASVHRYVVFRRRAARLKGKNRPLIVH